MVYRDDTMWAGERCYTSLSVNSSEGLVPNKRAFWVLSKNVKEISGFGKKRIPSQFKTHEEAKKYCRELNLKKGAYHPGYFIEERIGDKPVSAPSKKADDAEEDSV
jgi:hypothetical protein